MYQFTIDMACHFKGGFYGKDSKTDQHNYLN